MFHYLLGLLMWMDKIIPYEKIDYFDRQIALLNKNEHFNKCLGKFSV